MYYEFYGTGPKIIVFLHGFGGSTLSFKTFADALSGEYKILNLDFSGFGQSPMPAFAYDVLCYAKEVKHLLEQLHIAKCTVVAHSFGCRVAIKLNSISNVIEKLVVVDGAGLKPKFSLKKWICVKKYKFLKFLAKWGVVKKNRLEKFGSEDYKSLAPVMRQSFVKIVNENLFDEAKKITAPTLLVWGDKDTQTPMYMAKRFNKLIKNSELIVFENCGHFCYLDKPVLFLEILKCFLKE